MSKNIHATQDWVKDNFSIKNTASGEIISLSDSAEQPLQSMKIFGKTKQFTTTGKNLFGGTALRDAIVSTISTSIIVDEKSTVQFPANDAPTLRLMEGKFKEKTAYTLILSGQNTKADSDITNLRVMYTDGATHTPKFASANAKSNSLFVTDANRTVAYIGGQFATGNTILYYNECGIFEGSLTLDDFEPYTGGIPSPNPDYPQELVSVGDSGSTTEYVMGGNLFNNDTSLLSIVSYIGSDNKERNKVGYQFSLPSGKYTFSLSDLNLTNGKFVYGCIVDTNKRIVRSVNLLMSSTNYTPLTFEINEGESICIYDGWESIDINARKKTFEEVQIQLNAGSIAKPYEPYKEQSLTIPTPNGLPGIPVSSGGNYTDSNGQQYVCDEVDFGRGVYVRRVGSTVINTVANYGVHNNGTPYVSKTIPDIKIENNKLIKSDRYRGGSWSNKTYSVYTVGNRNVVLVDERFTSLEVANEILSTEQPKIYYELETPVETPFTNEEIELYKALHTNYPNTTIYNSDGAGAEVEYLADTKNYIDNKFANIENAILSLGGNI